LTPIFTYYSIGFALVKDFLNFLWNLTRLLLRLFARQAIRGLLIRIGCAIIGGKVRGFQAGVPVGVFPKTMPPERRRPDECNPKKGNHPVDADPEISATPRGYVLLRHEQNFFRKTIACCHHDEMMAQELYIVVDNGCAVLDVTVEHPVYGQISGQLQLFSRYDVDQFIHKLHTSNAPPLCALTNGVHLHTIQYSHEEDFARVLAQLGEHGLLFEQNDEG